MGEEIKLLIFYLGNITDKNFSLVAAAARKEWFTRKVELMGGCRGCPESRFCGGGCLTRAYACTGRVDQPYEGDCRLKKIFLEWVRQVDRRC